MIRTKSTQTLALAGFGPTGKLSGSRRRLLPVLALCVASAAWSQTVPGSTRSRISPNRFGGVQPTEPAAATPASAQYRFITIEIPGATGCGTNYYCNAAFAVSDSRLVVGQYTFDNGATFHGFAWQNGILHTLDYPGATDTHVLGTNNRGVVSGDYDYGDPNTEHVVTYSFQSGVWVMLPDIPNSPNNEGYGINDFGVAVGQAFSVSTNVAWIWNPSSQSYSFFAVPGAAPYTTYPGDGINDKGHVVGQFQDASGSWHGFLKEGETYTTIDPPDSTYTYANGINNSGTIVGFWDNLAGWTEGFIRTSDGEFIVMDVPGALETQIYGINNRGDICGVKVDPNTGQWTPFVAFKQ